jgi:hypothetical protein
MIREERRGGVVIASLIIVNTCLWLIVGFAIYLMMGCSARLQNATSIEWGEQLESNDSSVSIEEKKFVNQQGAI